MALVIEKVVDEKAKIALGQALDEEWTVAELEPLIYLYCDENLSSEQKEQYCRYMCGGVGDVAVAFAERVYSILNGKSIVLLKQLLNLTPAKLRAIPGIGEKLESEIIWALNNFHRHEEGRRALLKALMPKRHLKKQTEFDPEADTCVYN